MLEWDKRKDGTQIAIKDGLVFVITEHALGSSYELTLYVDDHKETIKFPRLSVSLLGARTRAVKLVDLFDAIAMKDLKRRLMPDDEAK